MNIVESEYTGSFPAVDKCPDTTLPEIAFIGRSNVGKSSLINMLTARKKLAKTSHTPGKTQLLNFFLINGSGDKPPGGWFLVDMPGYGYAKVSKKSRAKWNKMSRDYFAQRPNLLLLCVLIDVRLPPQQIDREFVDMLGELQVPFVLVFTKADKVKQRDISKNIKAFLDDMRTTWQFLPQHFVTSAQSGYGREKLLDYLDELLTEATHPE